MLLPVAIFFFVAYVIAVPATVIIAMKKLRGRKHDVVPYALYGFVYARYNTGNETYEANIMMRYGIYINNYVTRRKLGIVIAHVFLTSYPQVQGMYHVVVV